MFGPENAVLLGALLQIVLIDIVLAGDNAIVVGTAAAGLPPKEQKQVIALGTGMALVARIIFALAVTWLLLAGPALIVAGGLLLLYVAWKMWRDLRGGHGHEAQGNAGVGAVAGGAAGAVATKTFASAVTQVALADISMSLDNVLAVAGVAREHHWGVLAFGLLLSIILMAVAASYIAQVIDRYRWIAYVGIVVILWVALKMIWDGSFDLMAVMDSDPATQPAAH